MVIFCGHGLTTEAAWFNVYAGWATREGDFLPFELLVKMYYDCHRDGLFYKITVRKRFHERRSLVNTSPGSLQIQNAASGRSAERRLISVSIRTFVARRWLDINSFLLEMTAFRVIVQPRIKLCYIRTDLHKTLGYRSSATARIIVQSRPHPPLGLISFLYPLYDGGNWIKQPFNFSG